MTYPLQIKVYYFKDTVEAYLETEDVSLLIKHL